MNDEITMNADNAIFDMLRGLDGEDRERAGFLYRSTADVFYGSAIQCHHIHHSSATSTICSRRKSTASISRIHVPVRPSAPGSANIRKDCCNRTSSAMDLNYIVHHISTVFADSRWKAPFKLNDTKTCSIPWRPRRGVRSDSCINGAMTSYTCARYLWLGTT